MITSACATALAGLSSTTQSSSGSVDLHGAHFRGWNKYAGTYPAKMSNVVLIFADGAQIRARICAPVHVYAGGGGGGDEYAVTPAPRGKIESVRTHSEVEIGAMLLFFMLLKSAILCYLYLLTYIICAIETPCDANLFLPFVSIHFFNSRCYF